ncbi:MAG: ketoacyl-ACP synthase III [Acidobacteria bacterium]|nr:MAG: ketoacyl-ACP synthase III [Acidobacteriota bacterium]
MWRGNRREDAIVLDLQGERPARAAGRRGACSGTAHRRRSDSSGPGAPRCTVAPRRTIAMRTVIRGTGMYVPPHPVDNHRMARVMDTSHEWIVQRTGIVTRHFAPPGTATSDLAVPAARAALDDAGLEPDAVDYVVFATMTPDYYFPGSAPYFQRKLGLRDVPCLDIRQQCAGFIYGLQLADALIRSGQRRNVLLVGAEVHGGFMPWKCWDVLIDGADREVPAEEYEWNTRFRDRTVLFGDGAGAFVLAGEPRGEKDDRGLIDVLVYTRGELAEKLHTPAGGSAFRPYFSADMERTGAIVPIVEGREVYKIAVTLMPQIVEEILARNGMTTADLDLVVMHQANLRINEAVQRRLGLPDEKVFNNIQRYGNTTAATIPMAFHEARQAGLAKPGDLVCFVGLGSGLNWGAVLYRC